MNRKKTKKPSGESIAGLREKAAKLEALIHLANDLRDKERRLPMTFNDFLYQASTKPDAMFRDIFQLFYDMIHYYVPGGMDEYPEDKNSIGFIRFNSEQLFVSDCDNPFFADRLFMNRFMKLVDGFRKGTFRNNIFLFEGPPGSGKSTFLNNVLQRLEDYTKKPEGSTYKVHWKLNIEKLGGYRRFKKYFEKQLQDVKKDSDCFEDGIPSRNGVHYPDEQLAFSCPNHDHPILMIPKPYRRQFLKELIADKDFLELLFTDKQYEWVLKDVPCTICSSVYKSLLDVLGDPMEVYSMLYVRKNYFSRQLGEGISVFNPGDQVVKNPIRNTTLQQLVNDLFDNDDIRFTHSYLAKTNVGVLALMDIKENNITRLNNYHGIISDGVHKVELHEERINTLFLGLVNPEDKKHYQNIRSFQDRIIPVTIPYILDYNTELAIYLNKFGSRIETLFLPHVLINFAKIIISTRLKTDTKAIKRWIRFPKVYEKQVDSDLLLLKMDIYTGTIPNWLKEDDVKRFDRKIRSDVILDSRLEGQQGFSGRQSLILLDRLLANHESDERQITMEDLLKFFRNQQVIEDVKVSESFLQAIQRLYDYEVLQEVKQAIYQFNEELLSNSIKDYLFAINYDLGNTKKSNYTGNVIEIEEEYFQQMELMFLGEKSKEVERQSFRQDCLNEYVTVTLAQEMKLQDKPLEETKLYQNLHEKYMQHLKENSLAPYVGNDNFRRAIIDYDTPNFNSYPDKLRRDIEFMMKNLQENYHYTCVGAKQISLYVIDRIPSEEDKE